MPDHEQQLIPIDAIIVGERFRSNTTKVDIFAANIEKHGLLHALVVSSDMRLLAGGTRLKALQKLGWRTVPARIIHDVNDLKLREIELEENTIREDLSPIDRARLTRAIDDLKRQLYGSRPLGGPVASDDTSWSLRKTAESLNANVGTVHQDIRIANALDVMPDLAEIKKRQNILREIDRMEDLILNELDRRKRQKEYETVQSNFICGDSTSLILDLADHSVDCIITDPPYGLNLQKGRFGSRDGDNDDFDDSPESALALLRSIAPQCRRVLKPSGHLYAFFGHRLWAESQTIWRQAGFEVSDVVNIWFKTGPATGAGDWDYTFAPSWEPFIFASDRSRRLSFKHKNVFPYAAPSGPGRHHPTQKPIELLRELIQLSTQPNDLVFDPFAGVGSTLVAASQLRRRFFGIELNQAFVSIGLRRIVDLGKERPFVKKEEL